MTSIQNHLSPVLIHIGGMNCDHCVRAVKSALAEIPSLKVHSVTLGSARVEWADPPILYKAIEAIREAGFEAAFDKSVSLGGTCCSTGVTTPGKSKDAGTCCG